jgi:hypothetical protein
MIFGSCNSLTIKGCIRSHSKIDVCCPVIILGEIDKTSEVRQNDFSVINCGKTIQIGVIAGPGR